MMSKWIVRDIAPGVVEEELLKSTIGCYSYENHEAHGFSNFNASYIGRIYAEGMPEYVYEIYREIGGSYWYKTLIEKDGKLLDIHEVVFGRKEKDTHWRRYAR